MFLDCHVVAIYFSFWVFVHADLSLCTRPNGNAILDFFFYTFMTRKIRQKQHMLIMKLICSMPEEHSLWPVKEEALSR